MKECSKCKRQLDKSRFSKSDRYLDGLVSSCKDCHRATRMKTLSDHPLCFRCKEVPHLATTAYCLVCSRLMKGRTAVPKQPHDPANTDLCCMCKVQYRRPYHNYCYECGRIKAKQYRDSKKGQPVPDERRRKKSARHYINTLFKRGKIKRRPCEVCGEPSQHFHHLDYNDRTTNVQHLCFTCHVQAERLKRKVDNAGQT